MVAMKLSTYIAEIGDTGAAVLFGVKERTVASWRRGERQPRVEQAQKIVKATKGKVTFAECYQ